MSVPTPQSVLPEQTVLNIQENQGQIAIGQYVVQIGSVHGGVVNITMPEQQPALRPLAIADPALLPPPPELLLDRVAETETATRALQAGQTIEFIGEGGIGKTTLLEFLAHHPTTQAFPNGTVYLSARRRLAEDLLQELFEAFHEFDPAQPVSLKPTQIQLQRALRDKKTLLILDDANLERDELHQLKRFIPQSTLLLASFERHTWRRGEGQTLPLPGLPVENAIDLLEYELGRSLSTEEQGAARVLCQALEGHPDHLIQAAALIREEGRRLPELARQIQQGGPRVLTGEAVAALPDPQQQVIQALAALEGAPLSVEHLNAITGLADTAPLIEALLRRGIVQAHSPRYSLVGNLNQWVQQRANLNPWSTQALDHFASWAEARQTEPDRLLVDLEPILQSLVWGVRNGSWAPVLRLVRALEGALALSKYWGAWNRVLEAGLQAARGLGSQIAEAWALHQLGTRAMCLGEVRLARNFLTQALQMREALGDTAGAAITRHNLNLLLPPPPPTDSQPPGDGSLPGGGAVSSPLTSLPVLLAATVGTLLALALLLLVALNLVRSPESAPTPLWNVGFVPITATPTPTPTPSDTPTPIPITLTPTETPAPTLTPTPTFIPPLPPSTDTPTPIPPTATHTPVPPTLTPVPPGPEISSVDPASIEVGRSVTIRVAGNNFESTNSGFRVELFGPDFRTSLSLDDPRTRSVFEAVVPGNLPVGLYDLQVTNPDNQVAFKPAAFEVLERREPAIQLLPDRLFFSEQQLDTQSPDQIVTLVNSGTADLILNTITLSGANPREFNLTQTCPTSLPPNNACTLVVSFRPTNTGNRNATITITDNAPGSSHTVFLSGTGIRRLPDLVITTLIATGPARVNQDTAQIELPIQLTVRNQGDLSAEQLFKVTTDYSGGKLTNGQSLVIPFQAQATTEVDPRAGQAPFTRRTLPAGAEIIFTGLVFFDLQEQGETIFLAALADSCAGDSGLATFCRVEEENENNNRAPALSIQLPALPPVIEEVDPSTGAVGQTTLITVTGSNFRATEPGFEAALLRGESRTVLSLGGLRTSTAFNAQVPPTLPVGLYDLQVTNPDNLSGDKIEAFAVVDRPIPMLRISPNQLNFSEDVFISAGSQQLITLTNIGAAPLLFNNISLRGTHPQDFTADPNCPLSLAPNNFCTVAITFEPSAPGEREALLTIISNDPNSPHTVLLRGVSLIHRPDLVVPQLTLLQTPLINTRTQQLDLSLEVVIQNQGDVPASPFSVTLEAETLAQVSRQQFSPVPFTVLPTAQVDPGDGSRPSTRQPLPAGQTVIFTGRVSFDLQQQGQTVSLVAVADSCEANEGLPFFCRVEEQSEENNLSEPLTVRLPAPPLITAVTPISAEVGQRLSLTVTGENFQAAEPGFRVELLNGGNRTRLNLGTLRTGTVFEAVVSPTLPVGVYDLQVTNPDGLSARKPAAFTIVSRQASQVQLVPGFLLFPAQQLGTRSQSQQVILSNPGSAGLNLNRISLAGAHPGDFSLSQTCPSSLEQDGSCALLVEFSPTVVGQRNAVIMVETNALDNPRYVPLAGIGALDQPNLVITDFEAVGPPALVTVGQVNTIELPLRLTVLNQGTAPAEPFKVGLQYLGGILAPNLPRSLPFEIIASAETNQPLPAGAQVTFTGSTYLPPEEQGQTLALFALADSCLEDLNLPAFCRVEESDEENNRAGPLTIQLPRVVDPVIFTVTPAIGQVKQEVLITVEGENFNPTSDFRAELFNPATSLDITLGQLRTVTQFEAIVPPVLPPGLYDMRVTNPDGRSALKTAAFEVVDTNLPLAQLVPDILRFPGQKVGTTSKQQPVRLTNIGSTDLIVKAISLGGTQPADFSLDQTCSLSLLASAASCTLLVSFTPLTEGLRSANLTFETNATNNPAIVTLSGTGLQGQPDLVITTLETTGPATVDPRNQQITLPIQLLVKNQGDAPARIFKLSADYSGSNLDPARNFGVPFQAQPSAEVDASNSFYPFTRNELPAGAEIPVAGTLTFNSVEQNAVVSLSILADSCSGDRLFQAQCRVEESNENNNRSDILLIPLPGPMVKLEPRTFDFTFEDPPETTIILTNVGAGNLNIRTIAITGPDIGDFDMSHNCSTILTPGSSCQILVEFTGSTFDNSSANLTVTSNAPGSPHEVPLSHFDEHGCDNCD